MGALQHRSPEFIVNSYIEQCNDNNRLLREHQSFRVGISPDAAMRMSRQLKMLVMDARRAPFDRSAESQAGTAFCGRKAVRFRTV
ncbi:hypothetical protein [Burkholderia mayonis]|uniref:hypothetical protein n=1 Tax=Burkholderia mayonis TaxID=1385591 RepID=UPI00131ED6B1|nr:hypothetical protein [Burkholderia mayonis]